MFQPLGPSMSMSYPTCNQNDRGKVRPLSGAGRDDTLPVHERSTWRHHPQPWRRSYQFYVNLRDNTKHCIDTTSPKAAIYMYLTRLSLTTSYCHRFFLSA